MAGELHFNKGFHVEVAMLQSKRAPLYFAIGPGGVILEATGDLVRARRAIRAYRFPNLCYIQERRDSGVIVEHRPARCVSDFIVADLISRPFIT